ncbi:MAG: C4-dicarboxylate-specific signal transduction histidine kinase [Gammaproteobacteria bacterium]|jgi:C4-dicarboxylate-specific signal transduction histidine kinase
MTHSENVPLSTLIGHIEMREMFRWLGHELAQPLTAMNAFASAALHTLDANDAPEAYAALEKCISQFDRIRPTLAQGHEQFPPSALSTFELRPWLEEIMYALDVSPASLHIAHNAPTALHCCRADTQAVVFALVRNATEAISESETVAVKIVVELCENHGIAIHVKNPFIANAPQACWFNAFYTTKPHHLGIGLTVAQRLAKSMDGLLRAKLSGPQEVCFTFELLSAR